MGGGPACPEAGGGTGALSLKPEVCPVSAGNSLRGNESHMDRQTERLGLHSEGAGGLGGLRIEEGLALFLRGTLWGTPGDLSGRRVRLCMPGPELT